MKKCEETVFLNKFRILRAIAFALMLSLPSLYFYLVSAGYSPASFTHVDEFYYLILPQASIEGRVPFGDYKESDLLSFSETLKSSPNMFLNLVLGYLADSLNFKPVSIGIFIDFIFLILSYLSFSWMYRKLGIPGWRAEFATLVTLCLPWIFLPGRYLDSQIILFESLVFPPASLNRFLPVMRSVYTQVSYPHFAICLGLFFGSFQENRWQLSGIRLASFLGGLSLFIYFFVWLSLGAIMSISLLLWTLLLLREQRERVYNFLSVWFNYIFFFALGSAVPIYLIMTSNLSGLAKHEIIGKYWVFLPVSYFIAAILLVFLFRVIRHPSSRLLALVSASLIISECLLFNLQPLLKTILGVFHFSPLYLYPVFSGCIVIAWLRYTERFILVHRTSLVLLILLLLLRLLGTAHTQYTVYKQSHDLSSLVAFIDTHLDRDEVVSALTFNEAFSEDTPEYFAHSLVPNMISALSGRFVLHQAWAMSNDKQYRAQDYERELLTSFLFSGKVGTVWPCVYGEPKMPGDSFYLTRTAYLFYRSSMCEENAGRAINLCELLNTYSVNYVVWEKERNLNRPEYLSKHSQRRYDNSTFELLELDMPSIRSVYCDA